MVANEQLKLLKAHPEAMRRFCVSLEREATVIGIENDIRKILDSLRVDLWVLKECNLPSARLLAKVRDRKRDLLEVCAAAVGVERGKRLGKLAGERIISEAYEFASLRTAKSELPKLGKAKGESND